MDDTSRNEGWVSKKKFQRPGSRTYRPPIVFAQDNPLNSLEKATFRL